MRSNPNAYTDDRRATRFRVALRSWVVESPAHCDRVRTDYTEKSPLVKRVVTSVLPEAAAQCEVGAIVQAGHDVGHRAVGVVRRGRKKGEDHHIVGGGRDLPDGL
jgi:hypothetical protein